MAWIMPKKAKASSRKGSSVGSYMTGSGKASAEVQYIRDMIEKPNTILIKAPKKKRSKVFKWVTGAKNVEDN
jgi:hypothetical protein